MNQVKMQKTPSKIIANDGGPVWSHLGGSRTMQGQTFKEAIVEVLGDITYTNEPAATYSPQGKFELIPNQFHSMMRDPSNKVQPLKSFGIVSRNYSNVTPFVVADVLGPVLSDYEVHTVGIVKNGSILFVSLKLEDQEIVGELYGYYLNFLISFEPGRASQVYLTPVRYACYNANLLSQEMSKINLSVSHMGDVKAKISLAAELVKGFQHGKEVFESAMKAFTSYKMTDQDVQDVLVKVFPIPSRPKSLKQITDKFSLAEIAALKSVEGVGGLISGLDRVEGQYIARVAAMGGARAIMLDAIAQFDREFPHFKGTAYSVYNALTQTTDWREQQGGKHFESAVSGSRHGEKVRGAGELLSIVGV
tara:strand:- start:930 stop:2018 length:1089 start_codon:yes stop_codon:yes gene_type:complete